MIDNHPDAVYTRMFLAQERARKKWRIRKENGWWCAYMPNHFEPYAKYATWESAHGNMLRSMEQWEIRQLWLIEDFLADHRDG